MFPRMIAVLICATLASSALAADAQRGEQLYVARCGACHSLDSNGAGPRHRGVLGRRVASVPGFSYSPALSRQKFVWDSARLNRWISNPNALVPGNKMVVQLANDSADRADIVAFLTSAK
jgi:cytochrome c